MRRFNLAVQVALLIGCIVAPTAIVQAQYRASIQGVVTDSTGALVSGVTLTLKNLETGQTSTSTSTESGVFSFNGLPPSKFTLTAEKTGFKKKEVVNFGIVPEQANAVNVQLDLGQVTETVTVDGGDVPLLNTESANLGGSVRQADIQKLPSFGRDVFQLLQLAPGAFGDGAQGGGGGTNNLPGSSMGGTGGTDGIFKIENGGQITANGARVGDNNYQIDGVGTTSVTWGGSSVITPNEDSVKEVRVVTDNYDAENGRYRGAQVQVISQNGTNQIHGSVFFKVHRPGLNAYTKYNGYNSNQPGCIAPCGNVRDGNRFNDWGATAGGPILKNRLFAFFSYETLSNKSKATTAGGWYETPELRGLVAPGTNAAAFYGFSGIEPIGGSQLDQDCTSIGLVEGVNCHFLPGRGLNLGRPLTLGRGTLDPGFIDTHHPGTGGDGSGGPGNLTDVPSIVFLQDIPIPSDSTHRQYNGRLDFNATSKDLIAFSIYYVPNSSVGINGNGSRLANTFNSGNTNRAMTVLWNHTFGPTMANEVRANAAGWMDKDLDLNPSAPWGLPQVSFNPTGDIGVQGYGIGSFNGFDQWTYAVKDVLTKVHGAHTMKMGGEYTRLLSVDAPFWADRPSYTFNNIWDFLNDAPILENAQFDPKTGVPSALRKDLRSVVVGLFAQDNWKARPNLTITGGLRWEYFGPVTEKNDLISRVVLGQGDNLFTDLSLRAGGKQFRAQKYNFGPQLGFAWSPGDVFGHDFTNRLVIRGGFGVAYNGVAQSNTLDTRFNPPFVSNGQTLSGTNILYIDSFPSNINDPNGFAPNPAGKVSFDSNNLPLTGRVDVTALAESQPTTYSYHYTLGAEYDLGHNWVASAGYQGSNTRHQTQHYNLYNPGSAAGLQLNPKVNGITYYGNDGSARFNALLLELKHPFGHSFSLDAQYRLSHSMDSGSNAYAGGFYQWNMATSFANSDFDSRHAFKIYGVWSPTIFKGSNGWLEKIAGGWSLSGILNAHTGFPWQPLYNWQGSQDIGIFCLNPDDPTDCGTYDPVYNFGKGAGGSSGNAGSNKYLPAAYLGGFKSNYRSSDLVDATSMFTPPDIPLGTLFDCLFPSPDPGKCPDGQQGFGALPTAPGVSRNAFYGPGYFDVDATLSKSFGLPKLPVMGESAKLEIRANFYNLFNTLNLNGNGGEWSNGIQSDIFNAHFGQAQSALGSRTIEIQARFNF